VRWQWLYFGGESTPKEHIHPEMVLVLYLWLCDSYQQMVAIPSKQLKWAQRNVVLLQESAIKVLWVSSAWSLAPTNRINNLSCLRRGNRRVSICAKAELIFATHTRLREDGGGDGRRRPRHPLH